MAQISPRILPLALRLMEHYKSDKPNLRVAISYRALFRRKIFYAPLRKTLGDRICKIAPFYPFGEKKLESRFETRDD